MAHGYYLHINGDYTEGAYGDSYGGRLADVYGLRTTSYALFGQGELALAPRLNLTVGARYTWDSKTLDYSSAYPGFNLVFDKDTVGRLAHRSDGFWSGKVGLDYRLSPAVLAYVSVNRGTKAGSFNAPLDPTTTAGNPAAFGFKPEKLTDYEAGIKTDLLDRHLRLNLSSFYYDYKDYQALRFINLTQLVSNANATYYGGEVEAQLVPDSHWLLALNAAYSHGTVKDIDLNGQGAADYVPANAPRWSGNATLRYSLAAFGGKLAAQFDGNYVGKQYFALTDAPDTAQKAYALLNARLNYTTANGRWDLGVAVENLTDHHYATMAFDLASFLGLAQRYPGRPRWVSLAVLLCVVLVFFSLEEFTNTFRQKPARKEKNLMRVPAFLWPIALKPETNAAIRIGRVLHWTATTIAIVFVLGGLLFSGLSFSSAINSQVAADNWDRANTWCISRIPDKPKVGLPPIVGEQKTCSIWAPANAPQRPYVSETDWTAAIVGFCVGLLALFVGRAARYIFGGE